MAIPCVVRIGKQSMSATGQAVRRTCSKKPSTRRTAVWCLNSVSAVTSTAPCGAVVSPDRAAVVTIHRSGWEKQQVNSSTIWLGPHQPDIGSGQLAGWGSFFMNPTKLVSNGGPPVTIAAALAECGSPLPGYWFSSSGRWFTSLSHLSQESRPLVGLHADCPSSQVQRSQGPPVFLGSPCATFASPWLAFGQLLKFPEVAPALADERRESQLSGAADP
jgi:hypothetical protein